MVFQDLSRTDVPIQAIDDAVTKAAGVSVSMLRLDLVHPQVSGNKWFKLKDNLAMARDRGYRKLLSFGGPWSNHLHALAMAGKLTGFQTIGIVRGELQEPLNPCLQDARNAGMVLEAVSRAAYREKGQPDFLNQLEKRYGEYHLIPEGGANREGVLGCADIIDYYNEADHDVVCMACGTGTMLAGLATCSTVPLLGFQVLKGEGYLQHQIALQLQGLSLSAGTQWQVLDNYHCGGYARTNPELLQFITEFEPCHGIPLEPVYTGKMLYGLWDLLKKRDFFPQNSRILVIHGGGLQGRRGFSILKIHKSMRYRT